LPGQVGDRHLVVVGEDDLAVWPAAYTHEREELQIFTAKSSCSYHEYLRVEKLLLYLASVNADLIVIAALAVL